jgi:uncharacterized protein (DUF488 family)
MENDITMTSDPEWPPDAIYTVGHSTRAIDQFITLLQQHGIQQLQDIRTIPRSRRNPQFNSDALASSLASAGIEYRHVAELGGLRKPQRDSINTAWRNESFRGYADYMQTPEFNAAVDDLAEARHHKRIALMCAEAVPWRCHRSLVGDALLARGVHVVEIVGPGSARLHAMTKFAKVDGERVTYPGEA